MAPTVTVRGDCGELIAASYRGGIAHPSGYPLYCVAGRVFALFPWGEVAWRYNLFSAVCGALAVGVVAATIAKLARAAFWPALTASLLLAGMTFFGAQSVIAEVYTLNALLIAIIFFCTVEWHQTHQFRFLLALALLLGLSFNSHLSIVFVWPGVLWALEVQRSTLRRRWIPLALALLIGLAPTLYLPLRARTFPEPHTETIAGREYSWFMPLDWGHPADFSRWKTHVTLGQYDSLLWAPLEVKIGDYTFHFVQLTQTLSQFTAKLAELCGLLTLQFLWCTPLLLLGACVAIKTLPRLGRMLLLISVLNVGVALLYNVDNVFDIANFLFPTYIVLAIWMGLGIAWLLAATAQYWRFKMLACLALMAAVLCQWLLFASTSSFRGNTSARDVAIERASAAEYLAQRSGKAPSLLLLNDDTLFPFWYVQKVLGQATDTQTPWGLPLRAHQKNGQMVALIARFQQQGPVAIAQWNEEVDRHFPYVTLNSSGSLWLVSQRALPEAAQRASTQAVSRFARAAIRRGETNGFLATFDCPNFVAQKPWAVDAWHRTKQIGWVKVRIDRDGIKPHILTRRLIVAYDAQPGERLQVLLPLELPLEMPPGDYNVEVGVGRERNDPRASWRPGTPVQIITK